MILVAVCDLSALGQVAYVNLSWFSGPSSHLINYSVSGFLVLAISSLRLIVSPSNSLCAWCFVISVPCYCFVSTRHMFLELLLGLLFDRWTVI